MDGEVTRGTSTVDESMLTGEAKPLEKSPGAAVFGGTLNCGSSPLEVGTNSHTEWRRVTGTEPFRHCRGLTSTIRALIYVLSVVEAWFEISIKKGVSEGEGVVVVVGGGVSSHDVTSGCHHSELNLSPDIVP